eukprot:5439874-Prymnesium_polylepis.1
MTAARHCANDAHSAQVRAALTCSRMAAATPCLRSSFCRCLALARRACLASYLERSDSAASLERDESTDAESVLGLCSMLKERASAVDA